ncbi:hypothetical protein H2200_000909 [Cladophialophora chaetospira]|uniref:Uncharacterized protein n=1 Tax=Cladophialophora chaetospira TaxID=386627 RepID=A0AA38XPB2_9EURO|nr:hypothetical protein H2200_000909 [Cladophialophora chaetospira]
MTPPPHFGREPRKAAFWDQVLPDGNEKSLIWSIDDITPARKRRRSSDGDRLPIRAIVGPSDVFDANPGTVTQVDDRDGRQLIHLPQRGMPLFGTGDSGEGFSDIDDGDQSMFQRFGAGSPVIPERTPRPFQPTLFIDISAALTGTTAIREGNYTTKISEEWHEDKVLEFWDDGRRRINLKISVKSTTEKVWYTGEPKDLFSIHAAVTGWADTDRVVRRAGPEWWQTDVVC